MKNTLKKVLSLFTAILMTITLGTTSIHAEADPNTGLDPGKTEGILTLQESDATADKKNSEYSYFKVLDAVYVEGSDVYEYEWTSEFEDFANKATTTYGMTLEEIDKLIDGPTDYKINPESADKLGSALKQYVADKSITGTSITVGTKTNVGLGYYLVLETTKTPGTFELKPMLITVPAEVNGKYQYDVTVTMKDQDYDIVTKTIQESEQSKKDSWQAQVGTEHTYEVFVPVPYADPTWTEVHFTVVDTMDKGLTYKSLVSVETYEANKTKLIRTLTQNNDFTFTAGAYDQINGTKLTFDFSNKGNNKFYDKVKDAAYIKLVYKATINENASFGPSGQINEVRPHFGPDADTDIFGDKPGPKTKMYSGGLQITKTDKSGANKLEGAIFTVYSDKECTKEAKLVTYVVDNEGNITESPNTDLSASAETGKDGIVRFNGLGQDTYYIKETQAPGEYVGLGDQVIEVTVKVTLPDAITTGNEEASFEYTVKLGEQALESDSKNGIVKFDVKNDKGFTLPTTGGIGTYVFTIGGAVLILAAVVLFVRSRKETK